MREGGGVTYNQHGTPIHNNITGNEVQTFRLQFHAHSSYLMSSFFSFINWIFDEVMNDDRMNREITHHPSSLMKGKPNNTPPFIVDEG